MLVTVGKGVFFLRFSSLVHENLQITFIRLILGIFKAFGRIFRYPASGGNKENQDLRQGGW
jgi:hypothetical protein